MAIQTSSVRVVTNNPPSSSVHGLLGCAEVVDGSDPQLVNVPGGRRKASYV